MTEKSEVLAQPQQPPGHGGGGDRVGGVEAVPEVTRHPREIGKADLLAQARQPRGQRLRLGPVAGVERLLQQADAVGQVEDHLLDDLAAALVAERLAKHHDPRRVEHGILVCGQLDELCPHGIPPVHPRGSLAAKPQHSVNPEACAAQRMARKSATI